MNVKTSVSFPESLLDQAQKRWRTAGHTSLSAYLQHLVRQDISEAVESLKENAATYHAGVDLLHEIRRLTEAIEADRKHRSQPSSKARKAV